MPFVPYFNLLIIIVAIISEVGGGIYITKKKKNFVTATIQTNRDIH